MHSRGSDAHISCATQDGCLGWTWNVQIVSHHFPLREHAGSGAETPPHFRCVSLRSAASVSTSLFVILCVCVRWRVWRVPPLLPTYSNRSAVGGLYARWWYVGVVWPERAQVRCKGRSKKNSGYAVKDDLKTSLPFQNKQSVNSRERGVGFFIFYFAICTSLVTSSQETAFSTEPGDFLAYPGPNC